MTAPIWMAAPPEVHSAMLSSGPGPGSLLAAAASWTTLSAAYATATEELATLVAGVQAAAWNGPTAEAYAAAHIPYLAWLSKAAADSATNAARHQTAATAYASALAAMPTLAELAANHAMHAVLVATNFFGVNTIPIALNEADYVRMWIQAATVMSVYQTESAAAVASAPQTTPAPQIMSTDVSATASDDPFPLPPDRQNEIYQWLQQSGFIDFYNHSLQPLIDALADNPFFQGMFGGFDPWLPILGNPLSYLSPFNIAFALGYPMDIGTYVALLSQMFSFVALDLTAAFASGNPATIGFTILFTSVEVIGTVITDTIALLKTLLEQTVLLLAVVLPLLATPLLPLAAGAVLAPIGAKGLAALVAMAPTPPVLPPVTPPALALAPSMPTSPSSPVPTPVEATASAQAAAPPPPSAAAPPTATGAGTIGAGMGAGMDSFAYLVGDVNSHVRTQAASSARKKTAAPDSAKAPPIATTPEEETETQRRRRTKAQMLGRGYEYMDLEPDSEPVAAGASGGSAGRQGFFGTAAKAGRAAGLVTLADGGSAGGPRMPMVPSTWEPDPTTLAADS
jgi:PPE-repeat protein